MHCDIGGGALNTPYYDHCEHWIIPYLLIRRSGLRCVAAFNLNEIARIVTRLGITHHCHCSTVQDGPIQLSSYPAIGSFLDLRHVSDCLRAVLSTSTSIYLTLYYSVEHSTPERAGQGRAGQGATTP
jgi:hypothetical protein